MSINHTKNIIEVKNISFSYTNEVVLKDITLNIHPGDYVGVVGPNGGGKTTLLKIMVGLLNPLRGEVRLFSKPIKQFKEWFKIGYVPQNIINRDLQFPATVEEVVSMGRFAKIGLLHSPTAEDKKIVYQALEQVEMLEHKNKLIGDLSGGQQQRVIIARALASKPEIIFLDEPTVGIDVKTQEQFYLLLKKLNQTLGLTLILVSHDIDVVAHEATEVACINQTLVYHGKPKEFLAGDYLKNLYGKELKFVLHNH